MIRLSLKPVLISLIVLLLLLPGFGSAMTLDQIATTCMYTPGGGNGTCTDCYNASYWAGTNFNSSYWTGTNYNASYLTSTYNATYDAKADTNYNSSYWTGTNYNSSYWTGTNYNASYEGASNYNASYWTGTNYNASYLTSTYNATYDAKTNYNSSYWTGTNYNASYWTGTNFNSSYLTNASASSIVVNYTFTGIVGSAANVTNVGNTTAAKFDFTIPKGDTGDTGATGATGGTGGQILYFRNAASTDPITYEGLIPVPAGATEVDENVTVNNNQVLIDSYINDIGYPGVTEYPAGLWRFRTYHYVSSATGNTNAVFEVYNRTSAGTETLLFTATSEDINGLATTEYLTSYVQTTAYPVALTDRIVVKVYGQTNHNSNIVFHWVYEGSTHTSHIQTTLESAPATSLSFNVIAGATLYKGQAVYISGAFGGNPVVNLGDNTDTAKSRVVGLMVADTANGARGVVRRSGVLTSVDTRTSNTNINPLGQTWAAGDLLFATTGGGLTNIRPTSGRSVKAAYSLTGLSATDTLLAYPMENPVWSTAASAENIVLRMGDSAGVNKVSFRNYTNSEVAWILSNGTSSFTGNNYNASYLTSTYNATYDAKPDSTFNATYDDKTNYNASYWTGTNYNATYDGQSNYNSSYLTSTFNATYDAKPSSNYNATYDAKTNYNSSYWTGTNYNASYWTGSNYNASYLTSTYNVTYDTKPDSTFNATYDAKTNYNASYITSTYNATYDAKPDSTYNSTYDAKTNYNASYVETTNSSYVLTNNATYVLTNNASYVQTSNTSYVLGSNTTHVVNPVFGYITLMAGSGMMTTTNPGTMNQWETSAQKNNFIYWNFTDGGTGTVQWIVDFPADWNASANVIFAPMWTAQSGSGTIHFDVSGKLFPNNASIDTALAAIGDSEDTLLAAGEMHIGPDSTGAAITSAGTGGNTAIIKVARDSATDNLGATAQLLGLRVKYIRSFA